MFENVHKQTKVLTCISEKNIILQIYIYSIKIKTKINIQINMKNNISQKQINI